MYAAESTSIGAALMSVFHQFEIGNT
jgi:hypothetical protein